MKKAILVSFFILVKMLPLWAQSEWKLTSEKNGVKIYTSQVPDSKIKAIKVECEFNATLTQFVALMLDVKAAPNWVYHTKSCTLVKQVSASELYYYSEVSLPWPVKDRDFVAHLTVTQNPATKVVVVDGPAVAGLVPSKEKTIRIENSKGKWTIVPIGNDEIRVDYTLHVDPGGELPSWLVNMFATEGPQQIFKNLRSELQKPQYKSAVLPFIENYQSADKPGVNARIQYAAGK